MAYVGIGNRQDYVADFQSQNFSGDGSTTAFTLNYEAVTGSIRVAVDNVLQPADGSSYTVDGFTLNFDTAPASGTNNITILFLGTVRNISSVSDGAIINSKIQDNTIQAAKLAYDYNQYRNIIINGDMSIAQRGTSESGIGTSGGTYLLDRFEFVNATIGTWTMSQDTDVPTGQGFAKSLKLDCTTADAAPAAGDFLILRQIIEGQNLQYLKKGTANAESLTLSFWVKSSKTGTYIAELYDGDNARQISKSYTIDSASTWEKKTITYAGDTTGAFNNDNGASLNLQFFLGAGTDFTSGTLNTSWNSATTANRAVGQVNLGDSTSNDFWITGVQLEAGTTASDFEFLPYDMNLRRCQRYFEKTCIVTGGRNNTNLIHAFCKFMVRKRSDNQAFSVDTSTSNEVANPGVAAYSITSLGVILGEDFSGANLALNIDADPASNAPITSYLHTEYILVDNEL